MLETYLLFIDNMTKERKGECLPVNKLCSEESVLISFISFRDFTVTSEGKCSFTSLG